MSPLQTSSFSKKRHYGSAVYTMSLTGGVMVVRLSSLLEIFGSQSACQFLRGILLVGRWLPNLWHKPWNIWLIINWNLNLCIYWPYPCKSLFTLRSFPQFHLFHIIYFVIIAKLWNLCSILVSGKDLLCHCLKILLYVMIF